MKVPASTPEKPAPAKKSQPLPPPPPEPGPRRSEERDYQPRYVALPRHWERGHGRRNLAGGVVIFGFVALLLGWALYLSGPGALLSLAACLATATLLYVMARSRVFRQRNGTFIAWSGVALLGVVLAILHHGWLFVTARSAPVSAAPAPIAEIATGVEAPPLLSTSFPVKGDPAGGPAVHVVRDITVIIGGKPYLAKAGDLYPLVDVGIGELRFSVNNHEVSIPSAAGEVSAGSSDGIPDEKIAGTPPPPPANTAQAESAPVAGTGFVPPKDLPFNKQVEASQREAIRRYPALAQANSPQNYAFVSASKELNFSGETDFKKNPNWPLELAELLAEKEGWQRADAPAEAVRPPGNRQAVSQ